MKNKLELEIRTRANDIVVKELEEMGIDFAGVEKSDLDMLVDKRVRILEKDIEKFGWVAAISAAITVVTGI